MFLAKPFTRKILPFSKRKTRQKNSKMLSPG